MLQDLLSKKILSREEYNARMRPLNPALLVETNQQQSAPPPIPEFQQSPVYLGGTSAVATAPSSKNPILASVSPRGPNPAVKQLKTPGKSGPKTGPKVSLVATNLPVSKQPQNMNSVTAAPKSVSLPPKSFHQQRTMGERAVTTTDLFDGRPSPRSLTNSAEIQQLKSPRGAPNSTDAKSPRNLARSLTSVNVLEDRPPLVQNFCYSCGGKLAFDVKLSFCPFCGAKVLL